MCFRCCARRSLKPSLIQAALASPMFTNRWRWNATRALAVMRHSGGRKVPVALQRMRAEDLLAAVFPEQVMCEDNRSGPGRVAGPSAGQRNDGRLPARGDGSSTVSRKSSQPHRERCDRDAWPSIRRRRRRWRMKFSTPIPTRFSTMLRWKSGARGPFLCDGSIRGWNENSVSSMPAAIEEVRRQAWPEVRNVDELHDFLLGVGILPVEIRPDWRPLAQELIDNRRVSEATYGSASMALKRKPPMSRRNELIWSAPACRM